MKKSFYFALALTAGLFASCSSDELTSQAPAGLDVNDNEAAKIQLMISRPGVTRGSGTVGDLSSSAANVWAGQKFNLFMYEKGTFKPAQYVPTEGAAAIDIYNNAEITAPTGATTGAATYEVLLDPTDPTSGAAQYNYYPATGSFSFWAYRVDDAGTGTGHVGVPAMYDATGAVTTVEANAMTVRVPFIIDGSQDLLIGVADTTTAAGDLNTADSKIDTDEDAAKKIYSGYAARRGINPTLSFQHLLTRLTFQVKAASKAVSTAADDPGIGGWEAGFKVTKVQVYSKSEGNIIAAWKGDQANYDEKGERIEWTSATEDWADAENTLAALELKSRQFKVLEKADYKMVSVAGNATSPITIPAGYQDALGNTGSFNVSTLDATQKNGTYVVYTTDALDATTGMPTGQKTSLTAAGSGIVYIPCYNQTVGTEHAAQTLNMGVPAFSTTADASQPLVALEPVVPGWTAGTTTYSWGASDVAAYTAATATDEAEVTATAFDAALTEYATANPAAAGDVDKVILLYNEKGTNTTYDAGTDDIVGYIIGKSATTGGSAVATNVGEALLVAPADASGYVVKVTYTRTKKINATTVEPLSDVATINVVRNAVVSGVKTPVAFEAGKSYNVVVTLYEDGETTTNTTVEGWENGDGLDGEYDAE